VPAWIAVASANHVAIGRAQGFMQVNHGKAAPLRRVLPGDVVAYYSPTQVYGEKAPLKAFTALGRVCEGGVYIGEMPGGFTPARRDVGWWPAIVAPIAPLLPHLALTAGKTNWGYSFRFGLLKIDDADMAVIAAAMGCADRL
jgi:hypothetical protein